MLLPQAVALAGPPRRFAGLPAACEASATALDRRRVKLRLADRRVRDRRDIEDACEHADQAVPDHDPQGPLSDVTRWAARRRERE